MQGRILHGFDWCTWHQRFTWLTPQFSLALSYLRLLQFCFRHPCPCSSHDFSLFWVYFIMVLLLIKWWKVLHLSSHSFNPHLPVFVCYVYSSCFFLTQAVAYSFCCYVRLWLWPYFQHVSIVKYFDSNSMLLECGKWTYQACQGQALYDQEDRNHIEMLRSIIPPSPLPLLRCFVIQMY